MKESVDSSLQRISIILLEIRSETRRTRNDQQRILGYAADSYHRIDIRQTSRNLVVRHHDRVVADTTWPVVLYESGFAPRWYVPRADIDESPLSFAEHQTFCPYKGLRSYYDIGNARLVT